MVLRNRPHFGGYRTVKYHHNLISGSSLIG